MMHTDTPYQARNLAYAHASQDTIDNTNVFDRSENVGKRALPSERKKNQTGKKEHILTLATE